jgi:nucleoside-diphosphate-sugar epimerase
MTLYLITGIAGFIGSSLARELVRRGESVRGIDNFSTGKPENLADLGADIDFREIDLLDLPQVAEACRGVDYVLHQAAIPSVPRSVANPIETNCANIDGTLNLLVAARDAKVKRVVYASSSSLYGDTPTLPKREDMMPNPISPYAVSKLTGEYYMTSFYRVYGLETVSLRYFNVFGPRQSFDSPYSGVIAKFCTSLLRGEVPVIFGDGQQSRDFTFVSNAVTANLLAAEAPAARVAGKVFNVATGESISLLQLVAELNRQTKQQLKPRFEPPRVGDVRNSQADISAATAALGYKVEVSWADGLARTLDFYCQSNSARSPD